MREHVAALRHRISVKRRASRSISSNVVIGEDYVPGDFCRLWAPRYLEIGHGFRLGSNCRLETDGIIGDSVLVASMVGIVGRSDHAIQEVGIPITLATRVTEAPRELSRPTRIGSDVWIGYGVTILSGVTIGDSSIIGAGALVIDDVPSNSIAVGVPASVVRPRYAHKPELDKHWSLLSQRGSRTPYVSWELTAEQQWMAAWSKYRE